MYFMTYGGLSVYDGTRFTNYGQQNGLANEIVNDVIEITTDSFLIAPNASALNTLVNGKIGQFETTDHFYPIINRFLKGKDGSVYVTADDGLFKLVDHRFIRLPFLDSNGENLGKNLDKITAWKNYFLIIPWTEKQPARLFVYDLEKQKLTYIYSNKAVSNTAVDPDGVIWMSTSDGIEILDTTALSKGQVISRLVDSSSDSNPMVGSNIYFDGAGNRWLFINNQISIVSSSGEEKVISSEQGLQTSYLSDVLVDREGIIWMASDGNGVVKMPGMNLQVFKSLDHGIPSNISALYKQSDTIWLFNVTDYHFYRIIRGNIQTFPLHKEYSKAVGIYTQGKALYFTDRGNTYRINNKDIASSYRHPEPLFHEQESGFEVGSGIVDPYGNIIEVVKVNDTSFYLSAIIAHTLHMQSRISFLCDQMAVDDQNRLWIPTRDNHLLVFSLHPEDPNHYLRLRYDFSKEIEGLSPRSITVDPRGNVWIGTRYQGIVEFQWRDDTLQRVSQLTTTQGLTNNFNYYLYCDRYSNIWAGSETGLDKISIHAGKHTVENITKSKNLFQGIYKIIESRDKVLWALSSNGDYMVMTNHAATPSDFTPAFFITKLSVNGLEIDQSVTHFSYDQNNMSIQIAAPSFIDEKAILYSYSLESNGAESWSVPSNHADFDFINLPPGTYRLHIRADFPADVYPSQTLLYAFTIQPPFWLTWWFIAAVILVAMILLGSLVRNYYSRKLEKQKMLLEKKQALEKERTRIATDMHDDLGAGLSRIKFLSETIGIKQQQHLPIEDEINTIRHYSHDMIDKMGEIVWALNEKNDSLSDLLSYTRAYAMEYLAENGIESQIDKLPQIGMVMLNSEFRRNIYLSVKEVLHNVIKHAAAHKVLMQFRVTDKLMISIWDDGVGFDQTKMQHYGNGLNNIRNRMMEIDGHIEIHTDQGTRIVLSAPLPA